MKIVTTSLNPAIDQTVYIDGFRVDAVNRGSDIQFQAGGKGVNVAAFLADYAQQAPVDIQIAATGFLGRENAGIFEELFAYKEIEDRFVRIPGQTRIGVKIVDQQAQQTTDINMPGLAPSPEAVDLLERTLLALAEDCQWFVLTGSLPPSLPVGLYAHLIRSLKRFNCRIVLDTSHSALREAVQAGPHLIKPNLAELQDLCGSPIHNPQDALRAGRAVLSHGIEMAVVSMGARGSLFITPDTALHAIPPAIVVKSTVGAGDALVAGLLAGLVQGLDLPESTRLASAFALSTITSARRELPDMQTLTRWMQQVSVQSL